MRPKREVPGRCVDAARVLILAEQLTLGGAETLAVALAGALARDPRRRISFAAGGGPLRERLDARVRYHEVPAFSSAAAPGLVLRLAEVLKAERPDVIHAHGATIGVLAALAAKMIGLRPATILTDHNVEATRLPGRIAFPILDLAFDRIIALSRTKHSRLLAGGLPPSKLSIIPNFVDCDAVERRRAGIDRAAVRAELGLAPGQKVVVVAGRLISGKRMDRFIDILARYSREGRDRPVGLILGDGPERPELERLAKLHAAEARVVFLGYQPDIYRYLAVAEAFLFPSEHAEVLPMVLIEALAAGVPAVCSDIPGNNEIVVHGRTGYLVRGGDGEYASRLAEVLTDGARRDELASGARAAARESFHEAVVVDRIAALYDSTAARS